MKKIKFSLESLDPVFEKIERITKLQRILIYVGSFVILIGPFVYFSYLPKLNKIDTLEKNLETLKNQLAMAKRQASQIETWRKKYKQAQAQFAIAKRALPQQKEIPSLITGISESGQQAGLDFLLFKPLKEKPKNFYAEIPISIKVTGGYHDVATFFDKVSRLSRLVNIDNIAIGADQKGNYLNTTCTALTYRFLEKKPKPTGKKKPAKKK